MKVVNLARLATIAAAAVTLAGCGSAACPTETPKVQKVQSCTVRPGATVNLLLQLCPTCNQNVTSCHVDTSDVGGGTGQIFLDPIAEACEPSTSCSPDSAPACSANGPTCTFTAPTVEGVYTLTTITLNGPVNGQLTVSGSQTPSCTL